ncbi:MAG TPA: DUF2335 domain-containing protein [Candidatus Paceibacterota bacterium]
MNKNLQNQHNADELVVHQSSQHLFSGPLPPPEILKKYNDIVPGAAERIIKMAEDQSTHRKELEKKVIDSDISRSKWGQVLGFFIAIIGLVVSLIATIYGSTTVGAIIGTGTLVSLVSVFMYGSKTRSKEREIKKS